MHSMKKTDRFRTSCAALFASLAPLLSPSPSEAACPLCIAVLGTASGLFGASFPLSAEIAWYGAFLFMTGLWLSRRYARVEYFKGRGILWGMTGACAAAPLATVMLNAGILSALGWSLLGGVAAAASNILSSYVTYRRGKRLVRFQSSIFALVCMTLLTAILIALLPEGR